VLTGAPQAFHGRGRRGIDDADRLARARNVAFSERVAGFGIEKMNGTLLVPCAGVSSASSRSATPFRCV